VSRARPRAATGAALCACAVALTGCFGLIRADPSTLVLTQAELPAGFTLRQAGPYSNADVAAAFGTSSAAVARGLGRLDGYRSEFVNGGTVLDSVVSVYRGSAPAARALKVEVEANRKADPALTPLPAPRVGDQSYVFGAVLVDATTHQQLGVLSVYWRQNNVLGLLSLAGPPAQVQPQTVLRLAQAQDARIRRSP
jgi:hypothetical protein